MGNRIITGIRANGELHVGNYLGAMQPMVNLQQKLGEGDELFMFIPDFHSFTTPVEHGELHENIIRNIKMFIAAGVDPNNTQTILWQQSHVSAHAELTIILNNFTYFGETSRMTQFKDKSQKLGNKAVTVGLFDYPILMAADILLYGAEYVPLGDDQKQHMELVRTLAERFNNKFGEILTMPKSWEEQLEFANREKGVRIMSLSDPSNKMSKSIDDPSGTISLSDDPQEAKKKVMSATTDSLSTINYDPENQPGISNLLQMGALLNNESLKDYTDRWRRSPNYGELKNEVAAIVEEFLLDFQNKYNNISDDQVIEILKNGEQQARAIADQTLERVKKAVGIAG